MFLLSPEMNLITGYFKHSRKTGVLNENTISEVYISNVSAPNAPGEYLVSDGSGNVPVFRCVSEGKNEFRGYLKYKLGSARRKFKIVEARGSIDLLMDGKHFCVSSERSSEATNYLVFSEGRLQDMGIGHPGGSGKIQLEFATDGAESHADIVLSFLNMIEPQCHTHFFHFCISNISTTYGQVLVSYSEGTMQYHTALSPVFLNLNELFLDTALMPKLVTVPYFSNTNFILSYKWEEIYESKEYSFNYDYPSAFVLDVLLSVLLEERIVFYSKDHSTLRVLSILNLIKPFRWPHILCLPLPPEMSEILESPLPFIICLDTRMEEEGVALVDLDELQVHSTTKHELPFEVLESEMRTNLIGTVASCMTSMAKDILSQREELIRGCGKTMLKDVINDPSSLLEGRNAFYHEFYRTRMFLVFITEEHIHSSRYLVELGEAQSLVMLPYVLLADEHKIRALRLWIETFPGEMDPVIEYLVQDGILEAVADVVFRRLSYDKDYDRIWWVLSYIRNPTHRMYMNINIVSSMPRVSLGNLYNYIIYHLRVCDCRTLTFNGSCDATSTETHVTPQNRSRRDIRNRIRSLLRSMRQSAFDLHGNCFACSSRTSFLLVDGPEYSFLCSLLTPENISLVLKYPHGNLLETNPQAYWSLVAYFLHFDLPLTYNTVKEDVDLVIDESSSSDFQVDGRPKFYFDP